MGWYEDRFTENDRMVRSQCQICSRSMWLPPSKTGKYKTCGGACLQAKNAVSPAAAKRAQRVSAEPVKRHQWSCLHCAKQHTGGNAGRKYCGNPCFLAVLATERLRLQEQRARACALCGGAFVAKKSQIDAGQGRYCSNKCAHEAEGIQRITSAANLARAHEMRMAAIKDGSIVYKRGSEHHAWRGGRERTVERRKEASAVYRRKYRERNPDKVREFSRTRRGKKVGRLPRGTVKKIGALQRWRCAVCTIGIRDAYHIDHIQSLAKGGHHEPKNIQLLCPTCNVRKSAKDPISFMQERGFLL